ncbi:MAG: hypothetical protein ACO1TE_17345 [Prosthecobacter sp.]
MTFSDMSTWLIVIAAGGFVFLTGAVVLKLLSPGLPLTRIFRTLRRDRYDPEDLLRQLQEQFSPAQGDDCWRYEFENNTGWDDVDGFEAYLPAGPEQHMLTRKTLASLLADIRRLDNLVQDSCEKNGDKNWQHLDGCQLHLSHINLTGNLNRPRLCYFGSLVNTDWDAEFEKDENGVWQKVNF